MSSEAVLQPVVDRDECFGFGFCVDHAPGVFAIDETGHAVVIGVSGDLDLLKLAAGDCPRSAIDLVPVADAGDARPDH
jgi:ferredoxin